MLLDKKLLHTTDSYIKKLEAANVRTVEDLIGHYPRTYENKSNKLEFFSLVNIKEKNSSLVGYWDMETVCKDGDCGSGNDGKLKDLSGNGNDGSFSGLVLPSSTGGYLGRALEFSGSGNIITNNIIYNNVRQLTYSIFLKSDRKTGQVAPILIESSKDANTNSGSFYLADHYLNMCFSGNEITTLFTTIDVKVPLETTKSIIKCHNVLSTKNIYKIITVILDFNDPQNNKLYINGKIINTYNHSYFNLSPGINKMVNRFISNNKLYIGARGENVTNGLIGIIDDVKIYNRALSDEEIRQQARIAGF